jgi:hypothetical protein
MKRKKKRPHSTRSKNKRSKKSSVLKTLLGLPLAYPQNVIPPSTRPPDYFGEEDPFQLLEEPPVWGVDEWPDTLIGPVTSLFTVQGMEDYRRACAELDRRPELKSVWDEAYARAGLVPEGPPNKLAFNNIMERGLWLPVYELLGLRRSSYLEHREYLYWSCLFEGFGGYDGWAAEDLLRDESTPLAETFKKVPFVVPGYEGSARAGFFYHGLFDAALDNILYPDIGDDTVKHVEWVWEMVYEPAGVDRLAFEEANTRWVWGVRRMIIGGDKPDELRRLKELLQAPGCQVLRDLSYDVDFGTKDLDEILERLMWINDSDLWKLLYQNHVDLLP